MNVLLEFLLALLAALNVATGGPGDVDNLPDRPAIVAPTPIPAEATNTPESTAVEMDGLVLYVSAELVIVNGVSVHLNAPVEIKGQLEIGALVRVQGIQRGNVIAARQIDVLQAARPTPKPGEKADGGSGASTSSSSRASVNPSSSAGSSSSASVSSSSSSKSSTSSSASTSSRGSSSSSSSKGSDDSDDPDDSDDSKSKGGSSSSSSRR